MDKSCRREQTCHRGQLFAHPTGARVPTRYGPSAGERTQLPTQGLESRWCGVKSSSARAAKLAVRLRDYEPRDFPTLWEIDQLCYPPLIAYSHRALRKFLGAPGADCVVAEISRRKTAVTPNILAFCVTQRRDTQGYITTIDVLENYRKLGAGSALLAESETRLASHGVTQVALETAVDNFTAISFWERHGYRKIGVRKGYYPNGVDAFAMTKSLSS